MVAHWKLLFCRTRETTTTTQAPTTKPYRFKTQPTLTYRFQTKAPTTMSYRFNTHQPPTTKSSYRFKKPEEVSYDSSQSCSLEDLCDVTEKNYPL